MSTQPYKTGIGYPYDSDKRVMNQDTQVQFKTLEELLSSMNPIHFKFKEQGKQVEPTKQNTALDAVRSGGFIIGSIDEQGTISFASNPMVHTDAQSARAECKRLAQTRPGKAFTFVKFVGAELVPTASVSI